MRHRWPAGRLACPQPHSYPRVGTRRSAAARGSRVRVGGGIQAGGLAAGLATGPAPRTAGPR